MASVVLVRFVRLARLAKPEKVLVAAVGLEPFLRFGEVVAAEVPVAEALPVVAQVEQAPGAVLAAGVEAAQAMGVRKG
jgi:hypothetical protein